MLQGLSTGHTSRESISKNNIYAWLSARLAYFGGCSSRAAARYTEEKQVFLLFCTRLALTLRTITRERGKIISFTQTLQQRQIMELEKFDRQLRLMVLLAQNKQHTVEDISRLLGMNRRSIYRYIEAFRQMGFIVIKEGTKYRIDHNSPFFRQITEYTHFSEDEAMTINQVLNSVYDTSPQIRRLREKLASLYDFKVLARHGVDTLIAHNLSTLYKACTLERVAILRDYTSPNSGAVRDRIVEPYLFLSENSEVRCYEPESGMNKTFKISRAKRVDLLDLLWSHKDKHKPLHYDLFHFSGERRFRVRLLMGYLAMSLLLEEHPEAEKQIHLHNDGRWMLDTQVCSFKGIGRFVLGLFDDIEVVDSPEFSAWINTRIKDLTQKYEN